MITGLCIYLGIGALLAALFLYFFSDDKELTRWKKALVALMLFALWGPVMLLIVLQFIDDSDVHAKPPEF